MTNTTKAWLYSLGFGVGGLLLLWWAMQQRITWQSIAGSEFRMPMGRISLWHLTLVGAGLAFGLAVTASRRRPGRPRVSILAVLAVVPLVGLLYIYAWLMLGWAPPRAMGLDALLMGPGTPVAFPLVLGFLLSGMIPLGSDSS